MADQQPLVVECIDMPCDKLEVRPHADKDVLRLFIAEHDASATVYLDKERARRLFNWLGVWLHTG